MWPPLYRKDLAVLERVQKRFTRKLARLECRMYKEKFDQFELFSLDHLRLRRDPIEVYKIEKY